MSTLLEREKCSAERAEHMRAGAHKTVLGMSGPCFFRTPPRLLWFLNTLMRTGNVGVMFLGPKRKVDFSKYTSTKLDIGPPRAKRPDYVVFFVRRSALRGSSWRN